MQAAPRSRSTVIALLIGSAVAASACFPRQAPPPSTVAASPQLLPDVRTASGRPPVVLIAREGDPAVAITIAVTTAGIGFRDAVGDDPEAATALAGLVEARVRQSTKALDVIVTPSWDGLRASVLVAHDGGDATRFAEAIHGVLTTPATEGDLALARRKLSALSQRPLRDRALTRWARCVGEPHAEPERAGKDYPDVDVARLERWRAAAFGLGRVAIAVTAPPAIAENVAATVLRGPAYPKAALPVTPRVDADPAESSVDVFEAAPHETLVSGWRGSAEGGTREVASVPVLHATLDVGTSTAAVRTAEALGDPRGPLASRLSELDLPFRIREVTGAAHARGGCVGVVLEATSSQTTPATQDLATRVADAVALVRLEAAVFLAEPGAANDGRVLSRRSGNAREAAERGAWWALVDQVPSRPTSSITLSVPSRRGAKEAATEPSREALAAAVAHAEAGWGRPIVEARSRVESGQGEAWVLVGSPCGIEGETDSDAGLTALFVTAAADVAKTSADVRVEPWVAIDGAGLLVHGPALAGETPAAHARRLADIGARSFAAEPIPAAAIGRARADLLRRDARNDGTALSVLASTLAPQHPSWIVPWGIGEPLARSSDGAVLLRAQSLRAGPIRVAVLANADASQADAAVHAADRWVTRRAGDSRACRAPSAAQPARPGTYSSAPRPGLIPEAYLAFPFAPGDERARAAAVLVATALSEGEVSFLEKALVAIPAGGGAPLAREASAHLLGWPRSPALVIRIVARDNALDGAVMQARALVDRLHSGGLPGPDFERATNSVRTRALSTSLDPRARVVATWRGESAPFADPLRTTAEDVRAFAQKHLAEDAMIVVAVRAPRQPAVP